MRAGVLGQLQGQSARSAPRAVDKHTLARRNTRHALQRDHPGLRQSCRDGIRQGIGHQGAHRRRQHRPFGKAAAVHHHIRHDALTGLERRHPGPKRKNPADNVRAKDAPPWPEQPAESGIGRAAGQRFPVRQVHAASQNLHQNLAAPGLRVGNLGQPQLVRSAIGLIDHCAHSGPLNARAFK